MLLSRAVLFSCLAQALSTAAATLRFSTPAHLQASLPSTTTAYLDTLSRHESTSIDRSGHFVFRNISAGSYLLSVHSQPYNWLPLRVDVDASDDFRVFQTQHGIEWDNKGVEMTGRPVELQVTSQRNFYTKREGFSPLSFLKNPMILIAIVSMGLMLGMPYLIDNMDPETRAEFEEQSKKSPLTSGVAAGGNPLGDFDMAAWMAGASSSGSGDAQKGKGRESGGRRRG